MLLVGHGAIAVLLLSMVGAGLLTRVKFRNAPVNSYFGVRLLTAGLYFFRFHTNRVFIGRYTAPSLASVDLSKFSAEEQYLRRIINP
jgi:hypothetical protein